MEFKLEEPIYIDLLNSIRAQKDSQISRRNSTVEMEFQSKFVATTYDETVSEEVLFQNGDWEAACNKLDALESQGIELDAKQLALKSFCLSKTNASSTWSTYALLSIKNDPSQVLAYCAMATGALEKRNLQDAAYWLSLAHETGLSDLEPEYARSKLAYNYCEEHCTYPISLKLTRRCLLSAVLMRFCCSLILTCAQIICLLGVKVNIMLSKLIPCFKAVRRDA